MDSIRREVFAPDLVWHFPGRHPLAGTKHGPDEVIAFFEELNKLDIKIELYRMDNFGEDTVVETYRGYTEGDPDGINLSVVNCTHYRIQDGKIAEVRSTSPISMQGITTSGRSWVSSQYPIAWRINAPSRKNAERRERPRAPIRKARGKEVAPVMPVTAEQVGKAYEVLASGDRERIREYWSDDLEWFVPGHNRLSGWKHGLDEFLAFMGKVGQLSANSFSMESIAVVTTGEYSADETRNTGHRADDLNKKLDIDVIHLLRWRDGKVIEGKGAIFGDGTAQYDDFWGPA